MLLGHLMDALTRRGSPSQSLMIFLLPDTQAQFRVQMAQLQVESACYHRVVRGVEDVKGITLELGSSWKIRI
jgi:hypothetical protein